LIARYPCAFIIAPADIDDPSESLRGSKAGPLTRRGRNVGHLSEGIFWLVLPTLPMFLVLPAMLKNGFAFWTALAASCALTVALYLVAVWLLPRLGISM